MCSIKMWSINMWSIKMWSIKMWQRGREEGTSMAETSPPALISLRKSKKKLYKCVVPTLITIEPCGLAKPSKAMPLWGTVLLETPKRETNSMARVCWSARGCVVDPINMFAI